MVYGCCYCYYYYIVVLVVHVVVVFFKVLLATAVLTFSCYLVRLLASTLTNYYNFL